MCAFKDFFRIEEGEEELHLLTLASEHDITALNYLRVRYGLESEDEFRQLQQRMIGKKVRVDFRPVHSRGIPYLWSEFSGARSYLRRCGDIFFIDCPVVMDEQGCVCTEADVTKCNAVWILCCLAA